MNQFGEHNGDLIKHGEAIGTEPPTWQILAEHIHRGQTVAVMGPGASIAFDASFLTTAHLLGREGKLLVIDPKSQSHPMTSDEYVPRIMGPIKGAGHIDLHLNQLAYLYNGGMDIACPTWAGPRATCAATTLPDKCCDRIIDHNTSPFVTGYPDRQARVRWLTTIFHEYGRILRPSGMLLLQTSDTRYKFGTGKGKISLIGLLKDAGFTVQTMRVRDEYHIPLSQKDAQLLKKTPIETDVFDKISHNISENLPGQYVFERKASQSQFVVSHESVNMYLATLRV